MKSLTFKLHSKILGELIKNEGIKELAQGLKALINLNSLTLNLSYKKRSFLNALNKDKIIKEKILINHILKSFYLLKKIGII